MPLIAVLALESALAVFVSAAACKVLLTARLPAVSEKGVKTRLVWIDRTGHVLESRDLDGRYTSPRTFPGNVSILLNKIQPSRTAIFSFSPQDQQAKPAVPIDGRAGFGVLSPGAKEIVYTSWSGQEAAPFKSEIAVFKPRRLGADIQGISEDWSRDARWIALTRQRGFSQELWLFEISSRHALLFLKAHAISEPRFSPDGRWIAFAADFGGDDEIYRAPVTLETFSTQRTNELTQVSQHGGHSPRWGDSVNELFYLNNEQDLVMVGSHTESPAPSEPRKLFNVRPAARPSYEYRFDGYAFDYFRQAFVFALAPTANLRGQ